jgi:hypothetical protein
MAGGLILVGVLLVVVAAADMVLHAVTQMASNGRRALWRQHIVWKTAAASVVGSLVSVGWSIWLYVPDKAMALLLLGCSPFLVGIPPACCRARSVLARCWAAAVA